MAKTLPDQMEQTRARLFTECTTCGLCVKKCRIVEHTDLKGEKPTEIQHRVVEFLQGG